MKTKVQKEHQCLQKLVGEWNYETEAKMGEDQPPEKATGTENMRCLGAHQSCSLGGLWIDCALKDCGIGRVEITLSLNKLWNVGSVVILSLINMARCPMDINAISAPSASKPSVRVLTRFTTGDK